MEAITRTIQERKRGSGLMSSLYSDALEKEYPQECQEIRADEREKTINEIKRKIEEIIHGSFDDKGD